MSGFYPSDICKTTAGICINQEQKEKKLGWFTRWFDRKCRESWERAADEKKNPTVADTANRIDASGLTMSIYGADGGTVLEFKNYDHKKDRWSNTLHVISQNENFEERVAAAISMELLRNGIVK